VHHGDAGASNQIDHVTSGLRQSGNGNNNDDSSALIPVTSTNNQGSFVQTSPAGITTCAGIISATGEQDFPINHQNLVDHKGESDSIFYQANLI
jgi:hypothetical protein